ncbi:acyl-CoA dehydrogenase family protein [Streptomyces sp. NPDC046805]|uniref:acyl-CoA dehydrogenase family protein n=1 Tax=Streptomyces sp. NPDC046805 TaxID=3155134 RepID=UPI0033F4506A
MLGIAVPEKSGGAEIHGFRYNVILQEEAVRVAVTPAMARPSDVCMPYTLDYTNDQQKARQLPGIASGELITAIAMTSRACGCPPGGRWCWPWASSPQDT